MQLVHGQPPEPRRSGSPVIGALVEDARSARLSARAVNESRDDWRAARPRWQRLRRPCWTAPCGISTATASRSTSFGPLWARSSATLPQAMTPHAWVIRGPSWRSTLTPVVPSFLVGKRDAQCTQAFIADVASRLKNRVQISTDRLRSYIDAISAEFAASGVDYAQLHKTYEAEATGRDATAPKGHRDGEDADLRRSGR